MRKLILLLVVVFVATQLLGVAVGVNLIGAIAAGEIEQPTVVTENPEDPVNAIALLVYILLFTAFLLVFLRFFRGRFLFKALETLVVFSASLLVFETFALGAAFVFAFELVAVRLLLPKDVLIRDIAAVIAIAGVGALLGVALGVIPVLVFLILLACYDFIAVFKTRHMVTLAKGIARQNLAFTVAMPTREHQFELGTGDLVLPLVFAVSVMKANLLLGFPLFLVAPAMILIASLAGLLVTIAYSGRHIGKALPALPLQAVLMLAAWLLSRAVGF